MEPRWGGRSPGSERARPSGEAVRGGPVPALVCVSPAAQDNVPREAPRCPLCSLPRGLALGPSWAAERSLGVWCVGRALLPGAELEPDAEAEGAAPEAIECDCWKDASSTCEKSSSWRSLVKRGQGKDEANVALAWIRGRLQVKVCHPIAAGSELLHWSTEPQIDAPLVEGRGLASESEGMAVSEEEKPQEQLTLAAVAETTASQVKAMVQRGASPGGNAAVPFADDPSIPKAVDNETEAQSSPARRRQPAKRLPKLQDDIKEEEESGSSRCEPGEAKMQREETQSLVNCSAAKAKDRHKQGMDLQVQTEQVGGALREAVPSNCDPTLPPSNGVRLSARLAGKLRKGQALAGPSQEHLPKWGDTVGKVAKGCSMPETGEEAQPRAPEEEARSSLGASRQKGVSGERRHRCEECGKAFLQLCHLKKHRFVHSGHKPFLCTECGKSYSSEESFKAHVLGHQGVRPFRCMQCHKAYGTKRDLQEHQVLHTGQRPFTCPDCGKAFARRPSLRIHRKTHQAKMQSPATAAACQCAICGRHLANPGSLRNHMRLHTGERPYTCPFCPKSFRQQGNLRGHLRLHTGERPYRCRFCGDAFPQHPELRRHLISHTGEAHLCTVCGKALRDPHTLRAHERLHSGERPFRCPLCPKAYPLATKLRRHQKAHQGDKPHRCTICGMGYALLQSLRRHQLTHKGGQNGDGPQASRKGSPELELATEQPTVLVVQSVGMVAPTNETELLIATNRNGNTTYQPPNSSSRPVAPRGPIGHKDIIEITLSEHENECIIVQEQSSPGDVLIIQEGVGFGTVAEVVEVEMGT